jgi:organic hydroperoxide reductase OsmC/OhrA
MINFPLTFRVSADGPSGINTTWNSSAVASSGKVTMAIPPEFDGPGGGFSPEDIYALALQNCFVATFKVFAEKSRLAYSQIRTEATLDVDRGDDGKPWMARFHLKVNLEGVTQNETAKRILERVSQNCMILNSTKTEKTFEFHC